MLKSQMVVLILAVAAQNQNRAGQWRGNGRAMEDMTSRVGESRLGESR